MKVLPAVIVFATVGDAHAQSPDPAPDPYPAPLQPQSNPVEVPPQPQPQVLQLTAVEVAILQRGEIDPNYHYGGILANAVIGFGLGQAIQGRWWETGWKFTAGMAGSMVVFFGIGDRNPIAATLIGGIGLVTFYTWGLVDSIVGPSKHNQRVRELRVRHGLPVVTPYMNKTHDRGTAGLVVTF